MIYWLSFCDPDRPKGKRFLGAAVIEALDLGSALTKAWDMGCNPGGECLSAEVPAAKHAEVRPYLNRLMQRDELDRIFGEMATGKQFKAAHPDVELDSVCPACNGGTGPRTHGVN